MCNALNYLLDNIFIKFGSKLYRQIVGIQMVTNCAPLVADLFLFCYERDFLLSLSDKVRLEPVTLRSQVKHSTIKSLRSLTNFALWVKLKWGFISLYIGL